MLVVHFAGRVFKINHIEKWGGRTYFAGQQHDQLLPSFDCEIWYIPTKEELDSASLIDFGVGND